jgi:hypothetical protein
VQCRTYLRAQLSCRCTVSIFIHGLSIGAIASHSCIKNEY